MTPHAYVQPMPLRGRISRPQPKGLPVINMGFNELPWPPTPRVAEALSATAHQAQSYGSPTCDALREALARANGLDPARIVCGNGSEDLLDLIARIFARPGDEVLISAFGYIQFALTANRVGATLVKVAEQAFTSDVDALLAAVTERTKILFLANPNNPTGTMVPLSDITRLANGVPDQVVLVLDLAYGEYAPDGYVAAVHDLATNCDNVVVTRTFSKAYGLAGVRVGWCAAPDWMVPLLYGARAMGPVNALAQAAACAALQDQDEVNRRTRILTGERDRLSGLLHQLGYEVLPSQTNFLALSPPDRSPATTERLVEHLFDDAGLIVNRTREAGLERFLRVSLSLPDHNDLLCASLQRAAI